MEKPIKPCPICDGVCQVSGESRAYAVSCQFCGNVSPTKTSRSAAITCHNNIGYRLHKQLL